MHYLSSVEAVQEAIIVVEWAEWVLYVWSDGANFLKKIS